MCFSSLVRRDCCDSAAAAGFFCRCCCISAPPLQSQSAVFEAKKLSCSSLNQLY